MVLGSIVGGLAGAALGGIGANQAKKQQIKLLNRAQGWRLRGLARSDVLSDYQTHLARENKGLIKPAYQQAAGSLASQQAKAHQGVVQAGNKMYGNAIQSGISSGLSSSTVQKNMQMGVTLNTAQTLAGIDAQYAELLGNLGIEEAGATAAANAGIAQSIQNKKQNQLDTYNAIADMWGGVQVAPSDTGAGAIGTAISSFFAA
jgi:hypothetical protein